MYIAFEGIVGSGKTTQVKKLVEFLRKTPLRKGDVTEWQGDWGSKTNPQSSLRESSSFLKELPEVIHVREPGSTPIAEDIRYLAQGKEWEDEVMHPLTNAYLYAAARAQTLHTVVAPALERWDIVISDRSFLSSCAIQGEAQWLGIETILRVNDEAIRWIIPDIVVYLDIDIDLALSRISDEEWDKFEQERRDFYEAIVRWYEKCEKLEIMKNRFVRIDANGDEERVFHTIIDILKLRN